MSEVYRVLSATETTWPVEMSKPSLSEGKPSEVGSVPPGQTLKKFGSAGTCTPYDLMKLLMLSERVSPGPAPQKPRFGVLGVVNNCTSGSLKSTRTQWAT